jgi:putative transposase
MKFGRDYARRLKCKRASRRDIWAPRRGRRHHRRQTAFVVVGGRSGRIFLDEIVQTRRDTKAAKRLLTRLLKKQGCPPRRMITDNLGSYAAARRQIMPAIEHRSHKGLNNRAENSPASATTRTGDAGLSISGRAAAVHRRLLRRP